MHGSGLSQFENLCMSTVTHSAKTLQMQYLAMGVAVTRLLEIAVFGKAHCAKDLIPRDLSLLGMVGHDGTVRDGVGAPKVF